MSSRRTSALLGTLALLLPHAGRAADKEIDRLQACRDVIEEMVALPESIPEDLLDKARCVIVIPGVKKAAIGIGGRLGWGAASCRTEKGWSAPLMVSLKGGSVGFQIGGQSSDFVLLVMDPKGINHLIDNKLTLGADASVAAGPVGRSAEAATDISLHAEILSYSRSRGVFAGISLEGASLAPDKKGNYAIYRDRVSPRDVLLEPGVDVPVSAKAFVNSLQRLSPHRSG